MPHMSHFHRYVAFVATAILIGVLAGCERRLAPGEPGFVDETPIGNDVDDPATVGSIPIETAIDVPSGHTFRVLVDGVEVSSAVNQTAGIGAASTQYVHPEYLTQDRITVEVLTVDGWQPTTLAAGYPTTTGGAYTNADGSYRAYYGMKVLGDGRIVRNTDDYVTVDEIPSEEIEKLRCSWSATATHASRYVTVYIDHRTQPEGTLTFGTWSITLPAEFTGSVSPPALDTTTSVDVSLNGSFLGAITLSAYDPNQSWASTSWFIDTTASRSYACYLEWYSDLPAFPYSTPPSSQYTSLSGQALYSLPFTIDYFLQSAPSSVSVYTYGGFVGTVSKGVLQDAASYVSPYASPYVSPYTSPYVIPYTPAIPYTPSYTPTPNY